MPPTSVLRFEKDFSEASVAQRMSWAARRETTRVEDEAYCLFGLFGISMPTLYGEGRNAFYRLQEEIMNTSLDMSLLAWTAFPTRLLGTALDPPFFNVRGYIDTKIQPSLQTHGSSSDEPLNKHLLAPSPHLFEGTGDIVSIRGALQDQSNWFNVRIIQLRVMIRCFDLSICSMHDRQADSLKRYFIGATMFDALHDRSMFITVIPGLGQAV